MLGKTDENNMKSKSGLSGMSVFDAYQMGLRHADMIADSRPRNRFTDMLGRLVVLQVERMGSYWAACKSLGINSATASHWRRKALVGREPYAEWWAQVLRAKDAPFLRWVYSLGLPAQALEQLGIPSSTNLAKPDKTSNI